MSVLLSMPETAMGYQIVNLKTYKTQRRILFINSFLGFDLNASSNMEYKDAKTIDFKIDLSKYNN